jgi:hypothetical protein
LTTPYPSLKSIQSKHEDGVVRSNHTSLLIHAIYRTIIIAFCNPPNQNSECPDIHNRVALAIRSEALRRSPSISSTSSRIGLTPRSESVAVEITLKSVPDIVNPTTEVVNLAESSRDLFAVLYL